MHRFYTRLLPLAACLGLAPAVRAQSTLVNGLLAHYKFSGNLNDSSGNGHHATGMGGIAVLADPTNPGGTAAFFDGIDDWVSIPASPQITAGKRATIAFRFKTLDSVSQQVLVSKSDYAVYPNNLQYHFAFNTTWFGTNSLMFHSNHGNTCVGNQPSYEQRLFTYQPVQPNRWYSVVGTFDSGVKKLYVDGVLLASTTVSGYANNDRIDSCSGGTLRLGTWWSNDKLLFKGYMDDVRLYNRALTQLEAIALNDPSTAGGTGGGTGGGGTTSVPSADAGLFQVYPVPARDAVTLTAPAAAFPLRYTLLGPLGQVLRSGTLEAAGQSIPMQPAAAAGLYLLHVAAADGTHTAIRVLKY